MVRSEIAASAAMDLGFGDFLAKGPLKFQIGSQNGRLTVTGTLNFGEDPKFGSGNVLRLRSVSATLGAGCFSATGDLLVTIPQNSQTAKVNFDICAGRGVALKATIPSLSFSFAGASLKLDQVSLGNDGLSAASGSISLPPALGSVGIGLGNLTINKGGLDLKGVSLVTPQNLKLGAGGFNVVVTQLTASSDGRAFKLTFTGTIRVDVNGVKADAAGTIYLDSTGKVGGSVSSLRFEVAGMGVEASNITLDGATLRAGTVALRMPSGLGGASVTVYGLAVGPTGVKIGGGDFTLPEIKLGGFALALRGSFKVEGTTTMISAYGSFKMPILASNASAPGCSGIEITANIRVTSTNQMVIDIAPATVAIQRGPSSDSAFNPGRSDDFDAAAGSRFEVAGSVALRCTIPIPNTGFDLTYVKGSVVLFQGLTQVGIELGVATQLKINGTAPIAANGGAFVQAVPEFRLDLNAALFLFGKQAAQSTATIKSRSASFKLWVDYYVIRGQVALNAWSNETGFHFTGQGSLTLVLPKGLFVNEWWLTFPPKDLDLANVDAAVGEFTNGAWGFRGKGCVWKFCTGFYVDTAGRLTFRDVDQYKLLDPPRLARRCREMARGQAGRQTVGGLCGG